MNNDRKNKLFNQTVNSSDKSIKINDRLRFIKFLLEETGIQPLLDLGLCFESTEYYQEDVNKYTYNFTEVITKIGGKLKYIKSGTTGHTFQGIFYPDENCKTVCIHYAVKVVAYPVEKSYADINNKTRPENVELSMLKILSQFVITNQTPHIVLPLATFNSYIDPFINLKTNKFINNKKYDAFVEKYNNKQLHNTVSILISEWANGGDLLEYMRNNLQNMDLKEWRVMLFQILSVLAVIQKKYPGFRHNDMKANNILIQNIQGDNVIGNFFRYQIDNTVFYVPNIGYQIKLWDFDFACIGGVVENAKVNSEWTNQMNISNRQNRYYDICFFMVSLQKPGFLQQFRECKEVPHKVFEFFDSIIPPELMNSQLINERGRLLCDLEYTTPTEILVTHPFFNKLRMKDDRVPEDNFKPSGKNILKRVLEELKNKS
jgi:serine/threonine protein kinase